MEVEVRTTEDMVSIGETVRKESELYKALLPIMISVRSDLVVQQGHFANAF